MIATSHFPLPFSSSPRRRVPLGLLVALVSGCGTGPAPDEAALRTADRDSANWLTYGRTYSEQRFSPLRQIDEASVTRLGLAWAVDLGTLHGLEATSLVKDGVLYTTSAWSVVYAIDARTGAVRWRYDPAVPKDHAKFACCDVVNRGVALYRGRVYVGDARWPPRRARREDRKAGLERGDRPAGRALRHHRRAPGSRLAES